jgi:hypothetical protein
VSPAASDAEAWDSTSIAAIEARMRDVVLVSSATVKPGSYLGRSGGFVDGAVVFFDGILPFGRSLCWTSECCASRSTRSARSNSLKCLRYSLNILIAIVACSVSVRVMKSAMTRAKESLSL